jgi:hypothetical protein
MVSLLRAFGIEAPDEGAKPAPDVPSAAFSGGTRVLAGGAGKAEARARGAGLPAGAEAVSPRELDSNCTKGDQRDRHATLRYRHPHVAPLRLRPKARLPRVGFPDSSAAGRSWAPGQLLQGRQSVRGATLQAARLGSIDPVAPQVYGAELQSCELLR